MKINKKLYILFHFIIVSIILYLIIGNALIFMINIVPLVHVILGVIIKRGED